MIRLSIFAAMLSACSWTTFDDLEGETWVSATDKPDLDSANWGVAIQRGQASGAGGRLVVMGANQSVYSELRVESGGSIDVPTGPLELNSQFGIGNLDTQPILLADPASNDTALVTSSGSASIAVLKGSNGMLVVHQVFGPANPDAATYMVPPAPAPTNSQTLVAEGDKVFGTFFTNPPNPQPSCTLKDDAAGQVLVRALGASPPTGPTAVVLVWAANGKLIRYAPNIFSGAAGNAACATGLGAPAADVAATTFMPEKGSQILTFETDGKQYALLQGHSASGGFLALYDVATLMPVGTPQSAAGVKTAALLETGGKRYVVAGFPDAIVDGTTGAGDVKVFEISTATGIGNVVMTLHDAQPESKQAFGRGVTVMPFDGKQVIAVAADNEVFTYFRTKLYDETRAGR